MPQHLVFAPIPYTKSEVPLGSLVVNLLRPKEDISSVTTLSADDYEARPLHDYDGILKAEVAQGIFAQITRLLHLSRDSSRHVSLRVRAKGGTHYELNRPKHVWESLVVEDGSKKTLTDVIRQNRDVWFVTAVRTFIDTEVEVENGQGGSWEIKAEIPIGEIVKATTGVPTGSAGDISGDAQRKWELSSNERYKVMGERIFAIEFRKVIIKKKSDPSSSRIDNGVMMRTQADFRKSQTLADTSDFVVGFGNTSESLSNYRDELGELEKVEHIYAGDGVHYILPELVDISDDA